MLLPGRTAEEGSHILLFSNEEASKETSYILCEWPTWQSPPLLSAPTDLTSWRHQGSVQVGETNNQGSGDSFRCLIPRGCAWATQTSPPLQRDEDCGGQARRRCRLYYGQEFKWISEVLLTIDSRFSVESDGHTSKHQALCHSEENSHCSECILDNTVSEQREILLYLYISWYTIKLSTQGEAHTTSLISGKF